MGIRNLVAKTHPWFIQEINNYLMQGSNQAPPVGHFRPHIFSMCKDIDDMCVREMFYAYIGMAKETKFNLYILKRMMAGTAHHTMWENVFKEAIPNVLSGAGMKIKGDSVYILNIKTKRYKKIRVDEGANYPEIRGTCDWSIAQTPDAERELIEWKSGAYIAPKFGHLIQWNLYSLMTGIKKGWIMLESRDTADPVPFYVERDDKIISTILGRMCHIEKCAAMKKAVEKDERCLKGIWRPKSCSQYSLCYSEKGDNPWM